MIVTGSNKEGNSSNNSSGSSNNNYNNNNNNNNIIRFLYKLFQKVRSQRIREKGIVREKKR